MMRFYSVTKGKQRFVIAFPSMGLVIKVARIRVRAFKDFFENLEFLRLELYPNPNPEVRKLFWECVRLSFWRYLKQGFSGIAENWGERSYYKHTNILYRLLLKPTHWSFLGLVNVQKLGVPSQEPWKVVRHAFYVIAGDMLVLDGHHWDNPENFDTSGPWPQLLDYGNQATQNVINEHGLAILSSFSLEAGRERAAREDAYFARKPSP